MTRTLAVILFLLLYLPSASRAAPADCDDPAKPFRVLHKLENRPDMALEIAGHSRPIRRMLEELPGYPVDGTNFEKYFFLLDNRGAMGILDFNYAAALVSSGAGDYATARDHLLEFNKTGVDHWPVWLMLAALEHNLAPAGGKDAAAIRVLEEAEKAMPYEPGVYRHLAWLGFKDGKDDGWVIGALERGIKMLGPENAGGLLNDQALFILNSVNSANYLENLNRDTVEILKTDKSPDILAMRAAYNYLKGDYAKALEIYSFLYATGKNRFVGILGSAEAAHCLGDDEQAHGLLESLIEGYKGTPEEESLKKLLPRYEPAK